MPLIFSEHQKEEALKWYNENVPDLLKEVESSMREYPTFYKNVIYSLVDSYFKLKAIKFELSPTEFIIGINYKDMQKVIDGKEEVGITFQNPRRTIPADSFAQQTIIELLTRLKG